MHVLALTLFAALAFNPDPSPPQPRVRATDRIIRSAIAEGVQRSPSFRRLTDRLDDSDVIVHVVWDLRPRHGIGGHLTFAANARGVRYLRIYLSPQLGGVALVSVLGHELEHACEIAERPWIVDGASMAALYAAVGINDRYRPDTFETAAAVDAGDRIRRELTSDAVRAAAADSLRLR